MVVLQIVSFNTRECPAAASESLRASPTGSPTGPSAGTATAAAREVLPRNTLTVVDEGPAILAPGAADEHANVLGDFDVDAEHECALPTSALAEQPFEPDWEDELGPAKLVYPSPLPATGDDTQVWPVLVPTGKCSSGVELYFGTRFVRVPDKGFSTKRLPSSASVLQLRCVGDRSPAKLFIIGLSNKPPPTVSLPVPPAPSRPHILMLGQDSMARSAFMRHSPEMQRFMRNASNFPDHELFDFRYYHSLQYNTNGNTNPLFGNITYVQNPFTRGRRVLGVDLDNDGMPDSFVGRSDREAYHIHKGWLWLQSRQRGYSPWWFDVTFHRPVRGLSQTNGPFKADGRRYPRTMDLVHPHWVDRPGAHPRCKCLKEGCAQKFCFFNRHRLDLMWQRLLDAWQRHAHRRPVFLSMWSSLAHLANQGPQVRVNDAYDAAAFRQLFSTPEIRNAFVFYYSDHGLNYGATDAQAGITLNVESKRPMLFMWAPKWWLRMHPDARAALLHNRKALLTHFDMYRTLLEIMDGPGSWESRRSAWQLSLFQHVPRNRTCAEAHVPPTYCTCAKWRDVTISPRQVQALEEELNRDLPDECMQRLRVAEVESCSSTTLKRTHFDKVVTEAVRKDVGKVHGEYAEDIMTKVVFRLSERGARSEAPLMLATVFETGDLMRVTQLRQLTSYGKYLGCLRSVKADSQQFALVAEKCVCPWGTMHSNSDGEADTVMRGISDTEADVGADSAPPRRPDADASSGADTESDAGAAMDAGRDADASGEGSAEDSEEVDADHAPSDNEGNVGDADEAALLEGDNTSAEEQEAQAEAEAAAADAKAGNAGEEDHYDGRSAGKRWRVAGHGGASKAPQVPAARAGEAATGSGSADDKVTRGRNGAKLSPEAAKVKRRFIVTAARMHRYP